MLRLDLGLQKQLRKQARSVMLIFVSQQRLIIFTEIDELDKWKIHDDSQLIHYCKNETIQGINIKQILILICQYLLMSSCLFSENINFSKYDFIYACAQKDFGASGLTLIIAKKTSIS